MRPSPTLVFQSQSPYRVDDNEAYDQEEGYDDEAYEQEEGYDDEAYEQEEGYDDEAYAQEEGYDDEAFAEEEGYDDEAYEQDEGYEDEAYEGYADETYEGEWYGDEAYQDQEQQWYGDEAYQDQEQEWYGDAATQIRAYHSRHQTEVGDGTVGVAEANRGRKNLIAICLQQVDLKNYILGLEVALSRSVPLVFLNENSVQRIDRRNWHVRKANCLCIGLIVALYWCDLPQQLFVK